MPSIKTILIVDDHELFRAGVVGLISAKKLPFEVVEAESCAHARELLGETAIDYLILDFDLPDGTGIELMTELRESGHQQKVIMLTGVQSGSVAKRALEAGAHAVLAKKGDGSELIETLTLIETSAPSVGKSFAEDVARSSVLDLLTKRERETLDILVSGASTQELADSLNISFKTAETHRTRVMQKLEIHSYPELISKARVLGLIQ